MAVEIDISVGLQRLHVHMDGCIVRAYPVSTGANGAGEMKGSGRTPRGMHTVRAKAGGGRPVGSVFVGRRATGEIYSPALAAQHPQRDWILSRILWLGGCESGVNRGGVVDTLRRFIYIHGCPDGTPMGVAASHGCVRMTNADIVELFDLIPRGTAVRIME